MIVATPTPLPTAYGDDANEVLEILEDHVRDALTPARGLLFVDDD